MGGLGSGRYSGCGKATVEDGLTLDINKLVRDWQLRPGSWYAGTLRWTRLSTGEEVATIGYEVNATDPYSAWFRVHYNVNEEPQDYRIALDTTSPNYGGRRWWFLCPARGIRVAKLHLSSGGQIFASREAYGLAYRSQRERAYDRALTRTQNIRTRLGGSPSLAEPFPDKPKGMWWRTYERVRADAEHAEMQSWIGVAERFGFEF